MQTVHSQTRTEEQSYQARSKTHVPRVQLLTATSRGYLEITPPSLPLNCFFKKLRAAKIIPELHQMLLTKLIQNLAICIPQAEK